jgi:hypothetical protein
MSACNRFAASALLVLCVAPAARAADELYLRWDNCYGDGGAYNKVFACDTNSGTEVLVGSFRLAATAAFSAIEIKVDLATFGPEMPSWWLMGSSFCRSASSLSASFSPPATSIACLDPWTELGGAFGGFNEDALGFGIARFRGIVALPAGITYTAQAGQEVFAFQLRINHARTVGAGSCAGCSTPICIGWGEGRFNTGQTSFVFIVGANTPENGSNVTWQTGAVATTIDPCPQPRSPNCMLSAFYMSCQSVTPARAPTWGAIKSLYR